MNWISPAGLKALGILGMNRRNIQFIAGCNPRRLYPLVDNKLKTKQLAAAFDIPTPTLRFVVTAQYEIRNIRKQFEKIDGFAIKPAKGFGGKGILVISNFRENAFVRK